MQSRSKTPPPVLAPSSSSRSAPAKSRSQISHDDALDDLLRDVIAELENNPGKLVLASQLIPTVERSFHFQRFASILFSFLFIVLTDRDNTGLDEPKMFNFVKRYPDNLTWCRKNGQLASKTEEMPFVKLRDEGLVERKRVFDIVFSQLPMTIDEFKRRSKTGQEFSGELQYSFTVWHPCSCLFVFFMLQLWVP